MQFFKTIEDNSILIIPSNIKDKVLEYLDASTSLINIKIMSFNDLKRGLLFDYTNEAIFYLMREYHVNYGVAKGYLNDLYYLEDKLYDNTKMNLLVEIKQKLDNKDLLVRDNLFKSLLKSKKKLYVYGFDYVKRFDQHLLDLASKYIKCEVIPKNEFNYQHEVYRFHTMEEEVAFVLESIAELITKGIDINKIFIANYDNSYFFTFKRLLKDYNIPILIKSETTLYETAIGSFFLNNLTNNLDLLLYKVRKQFDVENNKINEAAYNKLAALLNNYYWCDDILAIKELIIEEMRHTKVAVNHHLYEIKTVNITNNIFNDDEYVFLIGFNLGSIPKLKRDEDYINDAIKPDFLENTDEYNKAIKETYIKAIKNIKNLIITYKMTDNFENYFPSFLMEDEALTEVKYSLKVSKYSHRLNKINLAKMIDNLIKFGDYNEHLDILNNTYKLNYKSYDNRFSHVDNDLLLNTLDNKINYSYSNIAEYYKCPFRFYMGSILNIKDYEQTLDQFIGSLFHRCLEVCLKKEEADVNKVYDEFVELNKDKRKFTNKDLFFIRLLKREINFIIEAIREQYSHSSHKLVEYEKRIEIDVKRKVNSKIKGFVDKVLFLDNYALIIDYKTNNTPFNRELFEFGIGIQLPIYLYLLKQLDSNIEVAGLYLQHILDLNLNYEPNKDLQEERMKKLKLDGITFKDIKLISKFDDSYENSKVIKGIKFTNNNEFYKNKNLLTLDERDELYQLMEKLIYNCIDNVENGDFSINPLMIEKKANGCEFCQYKDVCFRKPKDFNYQTLKERRDDEDE